MENNKRINDTKTSEKKSLRKQINEYMESRRERAYADNGLNF